MKRTRLVFLALFASAAASCRPATGDASSVPASAQSGAGPVASSQETTTPLLIVPQLPYDFNHKCTSDIDTAISPAQQLEGMHSACTPGLAQVALTGGESGRFSFDCAKHDCVRIGIVSQTARAPVRATLRSNDGRELATATAHAPLLLPEHGPVCVEENGRCEVEALAIGRTEAVEVRVWIARLPRASQDNAARDVQ